MSMIPMSGWRLRAATLALAVAALPLTASAQEAGPERLDDTMQGITTVVLMPVEHDETQGGDPACTIPDTLIVDAVLPTLRGAGLQAETLAAAQPFALDTPGLYLIPTQVALKIGDTGCVSWIELRAQSAHTLTLPSTQRRRTVQVLYWFQGSLLSMPMGEHTQAASRLFKDLADEFVASWRAQQG